MLRCALLLEAIREQYIFCGIFFNCFIGAGVLPWFLEFGGQKWGVVSLMGGARYRNRNLYAPVQPLNHCATRAPP